MSAPWTSREFDIVETLTRRVRLLSIEQIARIWWRGAGARRRARRRLRRLAAAGLLIRTTANVHPLLNVSEPLATWNPGAQEPDFSDVSRQAKTRWHWPSVPQEVFYASRLAANLYGSSAGQLSDLHQRDRDLLLGQVYLVFRVARPAEARRWIGEDVIRTTGYRTKDPGAFLVDATGDVVRGIESAGRYSRAQIENFHDHCVEQGLPYELW